MKRIKVILMTLLILMPIVMCAEHRNDVDVYSGFWGKLKQQLQPQQSYYQAKGNQCDFRLAEPGMPFAKKQMGKEEKEFSNLLPSSRKLSTIADLCGQKIMTVRTLRSDSWGDTGNSCSMVSIPGSDSVIINGFWQNSVKLKAYIDIMGGKISIPNQVIGQMEDNGDLDIAFCNTNGTPNRTKQITGVINSDGTITINDWWGIYVVAGTNKDRYVYAGYDTKVLTANGTMSLTFMDGSVYTHNVVINQPFINRVLITNFANYGMTVYVDLNSNRGGTIPSQVAEQYPQNKANFITCAIGSYTEQGQPQNISNTINLYPASTDNTNTLRWGNWTAISNGTQLMYFGAITAGQINFEGTFSYPEIITGFLEGEGTEASPYLVKNSDDLIRLAQGVNSVPSSQYNGHLNGVDCARVYQGKYFRLENDIDISSMLFTPIGADAYHYFAGIFDGNNHVIKNLHVSSTTGLAALFGLVDPEGVIKNLQLESPWIQCNVQTAGTVCGWNFGEIDNCHVNNADVTNYARIAGGVVGVGHVVRNCSVSNSHILGANGNPGGIAGQVDSLITNCHVINTEVIGATGQGGLPAGGVVAALTDGKGSNLSFSGVVDTRTYMCTMSTGGVVGVLSNSTLDQSFATGEVKAGPTDNYGHSSAAGGVVGKTYGSVIENCYFTGKVSTYLNRMTGGITGWLTNDIQGNDTIATTVRNCYTASLVISETYLYDKEKEARETIGWIDNGSTPTLSNLYYDNQLTNLNSTRYGTTTSVLTSVNGVEGFDKNIWLFTSGQYPRLKINANDPASLQSASAIILPERSSLKKISGDAELHPLGNTRYELMNNGVVGNHGHYCSIEGNKLKITDNFGTDTLFITNGDTGYELEIRIAPVPFDGEGTESNPFLLRTKNDLLTLAHVTSEIYQTFPGDYFLMTNDIDMEGDSTFIGICAQPGTAGTYNKFAGVFDGGGHSIKNLHMRMIPWTIRPEADAEGMGTPNSTAANGVMGIFGRLAPEGIIKNLVVAPSCDFYFWSRSGAIVGQNEGLVENCRNHADVWAASSVPGGIVGENRKGIVRRCYNDGMVTTGASGAGGIVGTGNGRIEECVNVGLVRALVWTRFQVNVKSAYRVGGIQGENQGTDFYDCLNFGPVIGYKEVGGIAGQLSNITSTTVLGHNELYNVINLGDITSTEDATVGALGGTNGTTGKIENAYWDAQISVHKAHGAINLKGAKGINTSELVSGTPLSGFSVQTWDFAESKYPVPNWCKDEPMLQHARHLIIKMPAGFSAKNFHGTATLSGLNGHSWELSENAPYILSEGKLQAPASVDERVSAVLKGKSGTFNRELTINTNVSVPLQGDGSETSPYLITSVEDWNNLADFIPVSNETFSGQFIKIANDIDFSGKQFKPLFLGTIAFEGVMDGAGHILKNISYAAVNSYEAVIGTIESTGILRNFKAQGEITTAVANTGGTTAKVYGLIENCENQMAVTATKGAGQSGFGYFYATAILKNVSNRATITGANGQLGGLSHNVSAEGVVFENCVNYGVIKSTSTATSCNNFGGLVATCYPATFINCHNEGQFEFNKPDGTNQVGGLIGNATAATTSANTMNMRNCYNLSDITANNIVGGLIANTASNYCVFDLSDCYNKGNIASVATKATSSSPVAGITCFYTPGSQIKSCENYGKITSSKNVFISGIAPYYKGTPTESKQVLISNCHNYGDIEALGNQGAGIMGSSQAWTVIDSCSNSGNITGGFGLAGICSNYSSANARISHCWNEGNITSTLYRCGGIVGWGNSESLIEDCFNVGDVATTATLKGTTTTSGYGIGGIAGYTGSHLVRCYNIGTITGASRVGGITGEVFKNRTQLIECYNAGEIIADADTCGSLIGMNTTSGKDWGENNKVENCYYIIQFEQPVNDRLGTMISLRDLCNKNFGDQWVNVDSYSLPIISGLNVETARLWSACLLPDGTDSYSHITYNFSIGCPDGIEWSVNPAGLIRFDANRARFIKPYSGSLTLTASLGNHSRDFNLYADNVTGIDCLQNDGRGIVKEDWYTIDGIQINGGVDKLKGLFILVRKYSDGSIVKYKIRK